MKLLKIIFNSLLIAILTIIMVINLTPKPAIAVAQNFVFGILEDNRPKAYEIHGIKVQTDIEYPSIFSENTFDFYEAQIPLEKTPTILWVHGGGFVGGDKSDVETYAVWLAYQGYNVISMNYELVPDAMYPSTVIQVNELVDFLQDWNQLEKINLDNLFFAGDSAGAQIAAQFAMSQTNLDYAKAIGIEPVLTQDQIQGMLLYCGIYDLPSLLNTDSTLLNFLFTQIGWSFLGDKEWMYSEEAELLSILDNVDENFPATYITDGNAISFEDQGKALVERFEELDVPVTSRFFNPDEVTTYHGFQFRLDTEVGLETFQDTVNFIEENRD